MKTICLICNKEFNVKPYLIKKGNGKFCSQKCYGTWRHNHIFNSNHPSWKGGMIKRKCKQCNHEFSIKVSESKKPGKGTFCSLKCKYVFQSQNNIGKESPFWKGGLVTRYCKLCNKEFSVYPYKLKKDRGVFCSHRCQGIWSIKNMKHKNTSIEIKIENELIKRNIPYMKQVPVEGIALVDFLLSNNIIIQCDGDYWHSKPNVRIKDNNQDFVLEFKGYKVYRFTETEIKKSAISCINKIF